MTSFRVILVNLMWWLIFANEFGELKRSDVTRLGGTWHGQTSPWVGYDSKNCLLFMHAHDMITYVKPSRIVLLGSWQLMWHWWQRKWNLHGGLAVLCFCLFLLFNEWTEKSSKQSFKICSGGWVFFFFN